MTITDNKINNSKLLEFIKNHYAKISILFYLSAFLVFGLLISEYLCDKTYFSDNALLPGFVKRDFDLKQQTLNNLKELRSLNLDKSTSIKSNESSSKIPVYWLMNKFKNLGLQVYSQQFQLSYPFGSKQNLNDTNVYAIFKGTRSSGTEALVLASPFRLNSKDKKSTMPGVALLISLAEYFSTKNYWSKDLIFLIYSHELVGCEAWLNAYFDLNDGVNKDSLIKFDQLEIRNGIIQAAINLDISTELTPNLDIRIEGLNGQLTNLDLFNVVVEIASRESVDATFHEYSHLFSPDQLEIWIEYAKTIGQMIMTQASTFTNGAHGLFQKRSIQSLTLVAEEKKEDLDYLKADLMQLGKIVEGIFRSCNNMIERFNRSYWFYFLPSTRRYVSIGFYMIPFGLIVLPSLLKALVIYLRLIEEYKSVIDTFWLVLPQLVLIHLYGIVIASFPFLIQNSSKLQSHFSFKTKELLFYSILSFMCSLMFSPIINNDIHQSNKKRANQNADNQPDVDGDKNLESTKADTEKRSIKIILIQKYIALLELALIITCISLVNISLALILSSLYIPIMCTISGLKPKTRIQKLINNLHKLLLLLTNPLVLIYLVELTKSIYTQSNQSIYDHLINSFVAQKQFILSLVEDWYLFGNWTFLIGSLTLFPIWLQFWYLT